MTQLNETASAGISEESGSDELLDFRSSSTISLNVLSSNAAFQSSVVPNSIPTNFFFNTAFSQQEAGNSFVFPSGSFGGVSAKSALTSSNVASTGTNLEGLGLDANTAPSGLLAMSQAGSSPHGLVSAGNGAMSSISNVLPSIPKDIPAIPKDLPSIPKDIPSIPDVNPGVPSITPGCPGLNPYVGVDQSQTQPTEIGLIGLSTPAPGDHFSF